MIYVALKVEKIKKNKIKMPINLCEEICRRKYVENNSNNNNNNLQHQIVDPLFF